MPASTKKTTRRRPEQPVIQEPEPTDSKYAPTSWGGSAYEDLRLPSGQLCLARRVGIQGLLETGVIHDIDPLMPLIEAHETRVEGKEEASEDDFMRELMKDKSKMTTLLHMLDRVTCHVVVKPHVEMAPNDVTRRKEGVIYTDMVDLQDKIYIMAFAQGDTEGLASFREEQSTVVGGIQAEQGNADTPE